jgi:hypothetical protein
VIVLNLDLDQLLDHSCNWLRGYLTYSTYSKEAQNTRTRLCNHSF